jgi:hypothetical protein
MRHLTIFATLPLLVLGAVAQDESKRELIELEITIGKRPPGSPPNPYLIKFTPKEPLNLEGKASSPKDAIAKGVEYILGQQQTDGSWKFDAAKQIRPDVGQRERQFQATAAQTMTPEVMTSLACMALRAHREANPEKIDEAVKKGLAFVVENAPKVQRRDYMIWTWSYAIEFMAQEYRANKDPNVLEAIKACAEQILKDQHAGQLEAAKLPAKAANPNNPKDSWTEKMRESQNGLIGAQPVMEMEIKGGVLIQMVQPGGPADKAGIKAGDRIAEVDGHEISGVAHLMDIIDSLEPGKPVKIKVLRGGPKAGQAVGQGRGASDGGWSYYQFAEGMTFTTATAMLALMDAKELGADIPQASIDRGLKYLEHCRFLNEGQSETGFTYRAHANKGMGVDIRGAIGRVTVCSLAMFRAGKLNASELTESVEIFCRRRGELDRVKGYPGNHFIRSFANAAYYFLYGHYNSALALNSIKDEAARKKMGAFIQEALLATRHPEGTWTDHVCWGELYGTSMALMALGQLKFVE